MRLRVIPIGGRLYVSAGETAAANDVTASRAAAWIADNVACLDEHGKPRQIRRRSLNRARFTEVDPEKCIASGIPLPDAGAQIRGPVGVPLAPVPEGYSVTKLKTLVDAGGGVRGQSVSVKPAPDPAITATVPDGHVEAGRSTLVASDGTVVLQWVKTRKEHGHEGIDLSDFAPRAVPCPPPSEPAHDRLLTVIPIGDPHIGLRTRDGETLERGIERIREAVGDLIHRGPRSRTAVIAPLGDTWHSDDPRNRTRRSGHELDVDGDWFDSRRAGVDLIFDCVETALRHHEHVHLVPVIGNHDDLSSMWLGLIADKYYEDEPRVTVDTTADKFMWFEHGRVLIGFHHGDTCKREELPAVMANVRREAWGRSSYGYWLTGHIHHTSRIEKGGCVIESFRTPAPRDEHSHSHGYVSGRDLVRIVYDKDAGEISRETRSVG